MRPPTIGLISCGSAKLEQAAPGKDLYTGSTFRAARRHAEAAYDSWWILSARHGLLNPEEIIAPYDETLIGKPLDHLESWAARVARQLRAEVPEGARIFIHAGAAYWQPLEPLLGPFYEVTVPCRGLRMGEAAHWHSEIFAGRIPRFGDPAEAAAIIQLIESGRKAADQTEGK